MEPTMIHSKISTTAAVIPSVLPSVLPLVLALVLPMAAPTASFAQNPPVNKAANGPAARTGGAPPLRFNGTPRAYGSSNVRPNAGAGVAQAGPSGGNWRGAQGWRGDRDRDRDRNRSFVPGLVTGVVIGGALASQSYGYYDGPAPGYYDDQYYDGPAASAPAPADDDAVAYCIQNFSSYDPASGTYLGNDGLRHPCP
jgi:hypothetical protein